MVISSLDLGKLRVSEFLQFSKDALTALTKNDVTALGITDQFNAFSKVTKEISALFKRDQGNDVTDDLVLIDARRDAAINGIISVIKGFTDHFHPQMRESAALLQRGLKVYGVGIARENYIAETATISGILNDWNGVPDLNAAIIQLKLEDWRDELAAANQLFNDQYMLRNRQVAAVVPDTIKEKRVVAMNVWYELRNFLDSFFVIRKGAEPYATTMNELNALIERYNTLLIDRAANDKKATPET